VHSLETYHHRTHRPRRFRNPWGVSVATAKRYGYPLPELTPLEHLEDRVAALETAQALRDGLALLDRPR
jgi:hypothetical protein